MFYKELILPLPNNNKKIFIISVISWAIQNLDDNKYWDKLSTIITSPQYDFERILSLHLAFSNEFDCVLFKQRWL